MLYSVFEPLQYQYNLFLTGYKLEKYIINLRLLILYQVKSGFYKRTIMKKTTFLLLVLAIVFSVQAQELKTIRINDSECANGHVIVKFKKDYTDASGQNISKIRQYLLAKYKAVVKKQWRMGAELWQIDTTQIPQATKTILDSLIKLPYIHYAEPDFIIKVDGIPNDQCFGEQWALNNTGQNGGTPDIDIDAPEAWEITTGDTNIVVGVIDTGIDYLHPDLTANIWTNWDEISGNGIDDDNNGYIDDIHGWDFYNNDNNPMDDNGHGTHVSGIIGAVGNNGIGIAGVAWNVKLMALKFLGSDGSGQTSAAVSSIEYANANGAKITNNSWSDGEYFDPALLDAVYTADTAGVLFIASAGNDGKDNDIIPNYPSDIDLGNVISVASNYRHGELSVFSNWGIGSVDIYAPGEEIKSTIQGSNYAMMSGTSMAAPHIAGIAALIWSKFPGFSHHQVRSQILGNCIQDDALIPISFSGGIVNAYDCVRDTNLLQIKFNKRSYDFRVGMIGSIVDSTVIVISNPGIIPFVIDTLITSIGFPIKINTEFGYSFQNLTIPPNDSIKLKIFFHPQSVGRKVELVNIYYTDNYSVVKNLPIYVKGFGIQNGTIITSSGAASGTWNSSKSPYYISCDITMQNQSLFIEPGTNIYFVDKIKWIVRENAQFRAIGDSLNKINFLPIDSLTGWMGISFWDSGSDDSLIFCQLSYANQDHGGYLNLGGGALAIMEHTNVYVKNCSIHHNFSILPGGGILISKSDPILINNFISNNQSISSGGGIQIDNDANPKLYNNIICNNQSNTLCLAGLGGGGIAILFRSRPLLINNTIVNNTSTQFGGGLWVYGESKPVMINNIVWGNTAPTGNSIFITSTGSIDISYSDIEGGYSGVNILDSLPGFILPSSGVGLGFNGMTADWHLIGTSVCKTTGIFNTEQGTYGTIPPWLMNDRDTIDFGLFPYNTNVVIPRPILIQNYSGMQSVIIDSVVYDSSHFQILNTFPLILEPLKDDVINLKLKLTNTGIFDDSIVIYSNTVQGQMAIKLMGEVTPTGLILTKNNCPDHLRFSNSPFFILDSISVLYNDSMIVDPGCLLYFCNNSNLTLKGSLIAIGKPDSLITFTSNCPNGTWNGINACQPQNSIVCHFCVFSNAMGSDKYNLHNIPALTYGGAILTNHSKILELINCTFCNNHSTNQGGALYIEGGSFTINNNAFFNNRSGDGGAVFFEYSSGHFINNTVSCNSAIWNGGGLCCSRSSPFLINNIISLNTSLTIGPNVYGISNTAGNYIGGDPFFANTLENNFKLQSISDCIDSGSNDSVFIPYGLDGKIRIWDGNSDGISTVDMGAYEYGAPFYFPNVPSTSTLQNMSLANGQTRCYNATGVITVAGYGSTYTVQTGASATTIAGQNIKYLPTTTVQSGGCMWGYIAPSGPWCQTPSMPAVAMAQEEIPDNTAQSSFKVYPNPTSGNFILELKGEADQVKVDIYGIWGEKMLTTVLNGERKHEFSLSDKPAGIYFVRVISGEKAETIKIIKQ